MGWLLAKLGLEAPEPDLAPERRYEGHLDEQRVVFRSSSGEVEELQLARIERVIAVTTGSGPWGADLWWCIESDDRVQCTPNGCQGERALLDWAGALPGFDAKGLDEAIRSTSEGRWVLWERTAADA